MAAATEKATADRPRQHDTAVAICCDERFQPYASFLAWQIAAATPARTFDIVIASATPLQALPLLADHGVRHVTVDTEAAFANFSRDARRSLATYLWMVLPGALGYRRILALDADIFHAGGDPGDLIGVDMLGHAIGAVRDNRQWRTPGRRVREFSAMGWPAAPYFNAGVILVDCERFTEERLLPRIIDFARDNPMVPNALDQSLVNCVLRGDWAELSPIWNWQYTWASSWLVASMDPNFVHFIGPDKPWRDAAGEMPLRYTAAYDAFLGAYFPQAERVEGLSRRRIPDAARSRRSLLRHWRAAGAMERYLSRFPESLTVRETREREMLLSPATAR